MLILANIGTIGGQARSLMSRFVKTTQKQKNESEDLVSSSSKSIKDDSSQQSSFDLELDTEQLINYGKFNDNEQCGGNKPSKTAKSGNYQETDLDQPVDFAKRYAENVSDSEEDDRSSPFEQQQILMEEDSVKCYFTEGTPQVVSISGSITDLRALNNPKEKVLGLVNPSKSVKVPKQSSELKPKTSQNSGMHSPEKPINYCEEGTPGGFSRSDSLSDLDEVATVSAKQEKPDSKKEIKSVPNTPPKPPTKEIKTEAVSSTSKSVTFSSFAQETPLMFSRTSSVESLTSAGSICVADDKSSVVSDFR